MSDNLKTAERHGEVYNLDDIKTALILFIDGKTDEEVARELRRKPGSIPEVRWAIKRYFEQDPAPSVSKSFYQILKRVLLSIVLYEDLMFE